MDQFSLARLEQLGRLKASGALSDNEFATAKAAVLRGEVANASVGSAAPAQGNLISNPDGLSPMWRARFAFMDEHRSSNGPELRKAMRAQSWLMRSRLTLSPLGFFLGGFYLLYLGLWRPTVSMFIAGLVYGSISYVFDFSTEVDQAVGVAFCAVVATICIPLYYLKVRRGVHSWNPFTSWRGRA